MSLEVQVHGPQYDHPSSLVRKETESVNKARLSGMDNDSPKQFIKYMARPF